MITNFKLYESAENYKVLGTNESSYHWEYDNYVSTARILLDSNENLFLNIRNVHVKTGLGAGTYPSPEEFVKIGTLQKADLTLVRPLLKKHQYEQHKFSKFWEDEEGNKMSLSDLIKLNKPEKPKQRLKHIETIDKFEKPITKKDIELVKYSERSYALFGTDTKAIKDELLALGCKYNRFLTDPKTGEKKPGWIVSIGKVEKVKELL